MTTETRAKLDQIRDTWRDLLQRRKADNGGIPVKTSRGMETVCLIQATERDLDDLASVFTAVADLSDRMEAADRRIAELRRAALWLATNAPGTPVPDWVDAAVNGK